MVNQEQALHSLWKDRVTVVGYLEVTDPNTGITSFREVVLAENQPCKLSFATLTVTGGEHTATMGQTVKLFCALKLTVPPGSKLSVTHGGTTADYKNSGVPGTFTYHQEIMLELFDGWA